MGVLLGPECILRSPVPQPQVRSSTRPWAARGSRSGPVGVGVRTPSPSRQEVRASGQLTHAPGGSPPALPRPGRCDRGRPEPGRGPGQGVSGSGAAARRGRSRPGRRGRARERQTACQEFVVYHAETIDVAGRAHRRSMSPAHLLGRHVGGGAEGQALLGQAAPRPGPTPAGQAEVHQHRSPSWGDHDVGRLQVAVDHPLGVGLGQGQRQRFHQVDDGGDPGGAVPIGLCGQGPAFEVGHGQVGDAVDPTGVVDGTDVGVAQQCSRPGLAAGSGLQGPADSSGRRGAGP